MGVGWRAAAFPYLHLLLMPKIIKSDPSIRPGFGDAVAAATTAVGVKPCGKCLRRKAVLNRVTPGWLRRIFAWIGIPM